MTTGLGELKPVKLRLKTDFVSSPARAKRFVNTHIKERKKEKSRKRKEGRKERK